MMMGTNMMALAIEIAAAASMGIGCLSAQWARQRFLARLSTSGISVPRRPREDLASWSRRIAAALRELHEASNAFLEAAEREGTVARTGPRSRTYMLPPEHPAAIRLERARGHDVIVAMASPYRDHIVIEG